MQKRIKISITLADEDILFLQGEISRMGGPRKTNMSEQIHIAVVQRMISMLPLEEQARLCDLVDVSAPVEKWEGQQDDLFDEQEQG